MNKTLTVVMVVLLVVLALVILSPERGLSKLVENCGEFISDLVS